MATANFFSKDGNFLGSVTDGSLTGRQCDYFGGGRFAMVDGVDTVHFGNVSAKTMSFDRSVTVTEGGNSVVQLNGVAVQKDVQESEDPAPASSDLIYVIYRVNT